MGLDRRRESGQKNEVIVKVGMDQIKKFLLHRK